MHKKRALLLYEDSFGGEIDLSIVSGFEANGYAVDTLLRGSSWQPHFDLLIGYGPFLYGSGHLLTVAKQLLDIPADQRPLFIWWLTENTPPPWIPPPIASAAARLRLWGDQIILRLPDFRWRQELLRAHRLRILGQLKWAWQKDVLDILVVTNRFRANYYHAHGIETVVAPLGYDRSYGADLGLERDIDVTFLGQLDSKRRSQILPDLFNDLRRRGISLVANSNVYEEERTILLNRSKILLNVLRSPQDFVGQRFSLASANRALTVSEPIIDPYPFKAGVHYLEAPVHELADAVERMLQDEAARLQIADNAYHLVTGELTSEKMVQRIIARAHELNGSRTIASN